LKSQNAYVLFYREWCGKFPAFYVNEYKIVQNVIEILTLNHFEDETLVSERRLKSFFEIWKISKTFKSRHHKN